MGELRKLPARSGPPEIVWVRSAGSYTSEVGWIGCRKMFTIIDRGTELALHPRIPGRDGLDVPSEVFRRYNGDTCRERAQQRATEMWHEFLNDLTADLPAEAQRIQRETQEQKAE